MKKMLFAAAAMIAAMTVNAQTVTKLGSELFNYLDIQAEGTALTSVVPTSTATATAANGTQFKGKEKSDGTEASNSWNTKDTYNTTIQVPNEVVNGLDSIKVGTMFRGGSGSSIVLGAFSTSAAGNLIIWYQPNGDSERGFSVTVKGAEVTGTDLTGSGVKSNGVRPAYAGRVSLPAGTYAAGDVVITAITNTSNLFGITIENLTTTAANDAEADAEFAYSVKINGQKVNAKVYNEPVIEVSSNGAAKVVINKK